MRFDGLVYCRHEPDRLAQGDDDFLVVPEVGGAMRIIDLRLVICD